MKLSTLYTTVPEYIEFGWVTAPNAAAQSIPANTITTLTLDTEVADTGSLVSAPTSNQFILPAGTYYFEAQTRYRDDAATNIASTLALYNVTDSRYITRSGDASHAGHSPGRSISIKAKSQFVISASKTFDLRLLLGTSAFVDNGDNTGVHTNSTAGADQRTTIKLWKLK